MGKKGVKWGVFFPSVHLWQTYFTGPKFACTGRTQQYKNRTASEKRKKLMTSSTTSSQCLEIFCGLLLLPVLQLNSFHK
jgi:hypothetical protein